jgi:hypothetical protein
MRRILFSALLAGLLFHPQPARAGLLFSGSGYNPEAGAAASGTALFSVSGDTLTLVLTNTTQPRTAAQGNALTGVAFDIDPGSPALTLVGIALTPGSSIWTSRTSSNTAGPLAGSWTDVLGGSPSGEYGIATTGFGGAFRGGSITRGNASPDYGIVADGTFPGPFGGSRFPFIQRSLTFTFTGASGLSEGDVGNVKLLFGGDGSGVVDATPTTASNPEPSTLALTLLGALGLAGWGARRRRASVGIPSPS